METFVKAYITMIAKNDIDCACSILTKGLKEKVTREKLVQWQDSLKPPSHVTEFMMQRLMIYYFEDSGVKFTKKQLLQVLKLSSS